VAAVENICEPTDLRIEHGWTAASELPSELKQLMNFTKKFKTALKRYLVTHCFYSIEEFYNMG
jgi:hypothetical protein